jgi:hypothetical protein
MVNPEHLRIVLEGADSIRNWRQNNEESSLNLRDAHLRGADLSGADLSRAHLSGADLSYAKLVGADLSDAYLCNANLFGARISKARLSNVQAGEANFQKADLEHADLINANLDYANLAGTWFFCANLSGLSLIGTVLFYTDLMWARLNGATMNDTAICGINLTECTGLETVKHQGSSCISLDTLIQSYYGGGKCWTPILESFLIKAGVPKQILDVIPEIVADKEKRALEKETLPTVRPEEEEVRRLLCERERLVMIYGREKVEEIECEIREGKEMPWGDSIDAADEYSYFKGYEKYRGKKALSDLYNLWSNMQENASAH